MIPSGTPYVGQTVLYCPAESEGFSGGAVRLPAIVDAVHGIAPDYLLLLAVIDQAGRITTRSLPASAETWELCGSDLAVPHWRYCEPF
jgi:hypothetical protein